MILQITELYGWSQMVHVPARKVRRNYRRGGPVAQPPCGASIDLLLFERTPERCFYTQYCDHRQTVFVGT